MPRLYLKQLEDYVEWLTYQLHRRIEFLEQNFMEFRSYNLAHDELQVRCGGQPFGLPGPENSTWDEFVQEVERIVASKVGEILQLLCPALFTQVQCPACDYLPSDITWVIVHLNDTPLETSENEEYPDHGWSREQIADWLETLDLDLRIDNATTPNLPTTTPRPEPAA